MLAVCAICQRTHVYFCFGIFKFKDLLFFFGINTLVYQSKKKKKIKDLLMCNRMLIFFSWFYELIHTGFHLMGRISSHRMMRFTTVLILWGCKRIFSEAFMHMVNQSFYGVRLL